VSGIFGFIDRTGAPAGPADLDRMGNTLAHRGPDHTGTWTGGSVGLGGCLLRTTPESRTERIPVTNASGDVTVTADARIDNRDELIAALDLRDRARDGITDSELILAAYQEWGDECPGKLLGDFAFAVHDRRRDRLFLARDPMGVRPLCWHDSPRGFAFASGIRAILQLDWVPRDIDETRIADHLVPQFDDTAITFYRGISRLSPGHRMSIRGPGARPERYWALDPEREIRLGSDDEYAEAFRDLFIDAVRRRLRSDGPVSALLSGGLDSSAIVCSARDVLKGSDRTIHTFSAIFPSLQEADPRINEDPYIKAVIGMGGVQGHFVEADGLSPLLDILWKGDEAIPAPNLYMDLALTRAVRDNGSRIVLSGWDGDSTVSHGLEFLAELARTGRWIRLGREARGLSRRLDSRSASTRRILWEFGFRYTVPDSARRIWRRVRGRPIHDVLGPVNPEFATRIGLDQRIRELSDTGPTPLRSARVTHMRSVASGLLTYGLELLDKVTSGCSIEQRYPFCDRRLVEFCLALPASQKLRDGWSRAVLRRAMAPLFPQEVNARVRKGNLSANFKRRLLDDGRQTIEEVLARPPDRIPEYLDMAALRDAFRRYAARPLQNERAALTVLLGVTLALWWRDGRQIGPDR
jgi:asparagine synthase (glutamine-hydrolysing)